MKKRKVSHPGAWMEFRPYTYPLHHLEITAITISVAIAN
jgi:hypothetical protein